MLSQAEFFVFFANTIFPLLETYRERLAPLYCADNGRPAWDPVRLLGVLVLQFVLRVTDRQAAEAVQYDLRWRVALHLSAQDAACDPSVLVVFRNRLIEGAQERVTFEAVLDYLVRCSVQQQLQPPGGTEHRQGRLPHRVEQHGVRGLSAARTMRQCRTGPSHVRGGRVALASSGAPRR